MRLFTGIPLPAEVTGNLSRLLEHLRPAAHIRWSPAYNLHVTTKFIGQWPDDRLDDLIGALQPLGKRPPLEIAIEGIGWFPNERSPRVLWVGVKAGPELSDLASATDEATAALGIERESRRFRPHLTIARIKDPAASLEKLKEAINKLETPEFGSFTAGSFHLYRSQPGPSGSIYTQLADIPFAA